MNDRKPSQYRWFLWLGLGVVSIGILVALLPSAKTLPRKRVTVSVDTNGTARFGGVPLPTIIRDAAFSAVGSIGAKAKFAVPATFTNKTQESNVVETLKSMTRAGLFTTNQPPNPYE
jgi:Sec7-like guanine-nucleotide exchange factor